MKRMVFTMVAILICLAGKSQYSRDIVVVPVLKTDTTTLGQGFIYPDSQKDEVTVSKITIQPGKSTGWHKHEFPVFAYVLKGTLTVELENHTPLEFRENSSFSEVLNTYHNGINKGNVDLVIIAFYLGEKGKALSVVR